MLRFESGTITAILPSWDGVARFAVTLEDPSGQQPQGDVLRALAYPELTGTPELGERVLLNTNALRRGLGTGGDALVVARLDTLPRAEDIAGHMVKARYTPMQTMVDAIDDPAGEHYETVKSAEDIAGMPVVVADLHSSLPAIVAGVRCEAPDARIVYVHTDGAALPAAYSATAAQLRAHGLLEAVISAGQSFGGDLEAVTVHSALLGARHVVGADVAIVIQGPGNLGTGTGWGFSGIQAAEALHAAAVLGGRAVATLRVSAADPRPRHAGLSHHSATTYGRAALVALDLPVLSPASAAHNPFHASVSEQVMSSIVGAGARRGISHRLVEIHDSGLRAALEALPVKLSTMGRGLDEDEASFLYAALGGRHAASLLAAA